ncbi:MAG: glycosyltransferase [Candidatus Gracilibacteria bacterium]|nr:glycosyltransferase [Candidatus Gracilibacteria bacterium]MDD3120469.1 glycosyltransferase [Candidatus Gracilibacteria bacterium]MDD4530400.1 glycosyltransferase [Candidatus Gracilibacteria bacterium]
MRIAVFTDTFYPMMNGIVTSTTSFLKELTARGHEVLVIAPYNEGIENFQEENIKIATLNGMKAFFYPEFKITVGLKRSLNVYNIVKEFDPQIIHFHTQFIIGFHGIMIGKKLKKPIVGTFHTYIADEGYLKHIGAQNSLIVKSFSRKYNNLFYNESDLIICPSENSKKELLKNKIKNKNIEIVPNPLPFSIDEIIVENDFIPNINGENIILYVGRLATEKELDIAIKSIQVVKEQIPDILFLIVGKGPNEQEFRNLVEKLELQGNVIFLGAIPHEKLIRSDIYVKSKLFLTASSTETQGITILEAMGFGLPIIGVDEKGTGELIDNGVNGYKFKKGDFKAIGDKIVHILKDEETLKNLGRNAFYIAKCFNVKDMTDKLENAYYNLLKR